MTNPERMTCTAPVVSILMPVKNTSQFLEECINSILAQTYQKWEVLAVDDHSEDNSREILIKYAKKDSRIKWYPNEGTGIISALRLAFSKSEGEYISRMDSDDIMMENRLDTMVAQLMENGAGKIAVGLVKYFSDGKLGDGYAKYESWLNQLSREGENFKEIYKECVIPSPCWMVRRKDLIYCGAFESNIYPEDYDLSFRFFGGGMQVIPSSAVLHKWRDYSNRTSRIDSNYSDNNFLDLKMQYFLTITWNERKGLVLWGAGKKGKKIAQILLKKGLAFRWVSNNRKKAGIEIYNKQIIDEEANTISKNDQYIIAVANKEEQEDIGKKLKGMEYYMFC